MRIAVIALTKKAALLASEIAERLDADLHVQEKYLTLFAATRRVTGYQLPVEQHSKHLFAEYQGIIYVMATGIVVRSVAPLLRSKLVDPAVVVVDEKGRYAISLLSGHLGGANDLARQVAAAIDAEPVITTATDINGLVACDVLARRNDCTIENPALIKNLNTALLEGKPLALFTPFPVLGSSEGYQINPNKPVASNIVLDYQRSHRLAGCTLYLRPRHLAVGIGCRRGTSFDQLYKALQVFLEQQDICLSAIGKIASIDLKVDEAGLIALADRLRVPFLTFPAEQLAQVEGVVAHSGFVQQVTGTGNVCEAAALLAAPAGNLLVQKTIINSITFAIAAADFQLAF